MKNLTRSRAALAAVTSASLLGGGVVGIALGAPSVVGAQDDTPPESPETDGPQPLVASVFEDLVAEDVISQEQADTIQQRLREAHQEAHARFREGRADRLDALTEVLGVDAEALRQALRDGQSLAEIAEENGVEVDAVVDALITEVAEERDLSEEQLRRLTERVEAKINGEIGRFGPRHHHHFDRHGDPDEA